MVRNIDGSYILYAFGALLGIASVLYFGQEVLLSLSPAIKATLLFVAFVFFLVAGVSTEHNTFNTVLVTLATGTYIIFLGYTIVRFQLSTSRIFLALAASSALLIGTAYAIRERGFTFTRQQRNYMLAGCLAIVALLVVADMVGPQATVSADFTDTIDLSAPSDGRVAIGAVHAENPFIFSRIAEFPRYDACLVTTNASAQQRVMTRIDDSHRGSILLGGGETLQKPIEARFPRVAGAPDHPDRPDDSLDYSSLGTVPVVQRDECPDVLDVPTLVVTESRGR